MGIRAAVEYWIYSEMFVALCLGTQIEHAVIFHSFSKCASGQTVLKCDRLFGERIRNIWSGFSYVLQLPTCTIKGCYVSWFDYACKLFSSPSEIGTFLCMFVQHSAPMTASNLCFGGNSEVWHAKCQVLKYDGNKLLKRLLNLGCLFQPSTFVQTTDTQELHADSCLFLIPCACDLPCAICLLQGDTGLIGPPGLQGPPVREIYIFLMIYISLFCRLECQFICTIHNTVFYERGHEVVVFSEDFFCSYS